jgi:hypothetical protein
MNTDSGCKIMEREATPKRMRYQSDQM